MPEVLESRALLTPVIVEPASGSTTFDQTPRIEWTDDGADSYEIWVSELGANPQAVYLEDGIVGTSVSVPQTLEEQDHRIWVRGTYSGVAGSWSPARDFTIDSGRPESLAATNITAGGATLSWSAVDGAESYSVWINEDGGSTVLQLHHDITATSMSVTGLAGNTGHTFWVQAVSNDGTTSAWSPAEDFQTSASGITGLQPTLTGPASAISVTGARLTWGHMPAAASYTVWLSDLSVGQILLQEGIDRNDYWVAGLEAGKTYRYWVQAVDSAGQTSQWSTARDFYVGSPSVPYVITDDTSLSPGTIFPGTDLIVEPGIELTLYNGQPLQLNSLLLRQGASLRVGSLTLDIGTMILEEGAVLHADSNLDLKLHQHSFVDANGRVSSDVQFTLEGSVTLGSDAAVYAATPVYNGSSGGIQSAIYTQGRAADSDYDGLSDAGEFSAGTRARAADTDGDLLLDGFEALYGLNPWSPDDVTSNTDGDGLDLFDEQVFGTNPFASDTDQDGTPDDVEAASGGDPTSAADGGVSPAPHEVVTVRLTVGDHSSSESERYVLQVGGIRHQSRSFGDVSTRDFVLRLDPEQEHEVRVIHVATSPQQGSPDYDYTALIAKLPSEQEVFHICFRDPFPILGVYNTDSSEFRAAGHEAILTVAAVAGSPSQWHHLLPQQFRSEFEQVGYAIDDAAWGLLLDADDHAMVHPRWNDEWQMFWDINDPSTTSQQDVYDELERLYNIQEYSDVYERGAKPHVRYQQWNSLPAYAKSKAFRILRSSLTLLTATFVAIGGAESANAAFAPAIALGNEQALNDYKSVLSHLASGDKLRARKALLGTDIDVDLSLINGNTSSPGLIPKMLNAMIDADSLTLFQSQGAYIRAAEAWDRAVRELCDSCI